MPAKKPPDMPVLVLDDGELDIVELAIGGALSEIEIPTPERFQGTAILADSESTPIALFTAVNNQGHRLRGVVSALRARAHRLGAAWDPAFRRAASEVRETVGDDLLAIVFREVPSRADLERIATAVGNRPLAWVALTSSADQPGVLDDDALTRAVMAARPDGATGLVVPAATGSVRVTANLDLDSLMARYGASAVVDVSAERPEHERKKREATSDVEELFPPASAAELARLRRRRSGLMGGMVLFTGLSGSGKSTVAKALATRIEAEFERATVLLDGDEVRQLLSSELGFDRLSRELNVRRIGYVGSLVARSGGLAIAAPIAPFDSTRQEIRARVEGEGFFLLVHIATPLEVCEERDRKGLYSKARAGLIDDFTGISSPYEAPLDADVVVDTSLLSVDEAVAAVFDALPI